MVFIISDYKYRTKAAGLSFYFTVRVNGEKHFREEKNSETWLIKFLSLNSSGCFLVAALNKHLHDVGISECEGWIGLYQQNKASSIRAHCDHESRDGAQTLFIYLKN